MFVFCLRFMLPRDECVMGASEAHTSVRQRASMALLEDYVDDLTSKIPRETCDAYYV